MAHEIVEKFLNGAKIRDKNWLNRDSYISVGADRQIYNNSRDEKNHFWQSIMMSPHSWELYQEPKKAWIDSKEFLSKCEAIEDDNLHPQGQGDGAIVLAREFLKRADEKYIHLKEEPAYKIMSDLVGSENLKDVK